MFPSQNSDDFLDIPQSLVLVRRCLMSFVFFILWITFYWNGTMQKKNNVKRQVWYPVPESSVVVSENEQNLDQQV